MKNFIKVLFALLITVGLSSCMKDKSYEPYDGQAMLEKEAPVLKEYVESTESLEDAILDPTTGIWYKIIEEGVGPEDEGFYEYITNVNGRVTEAPVVTVKYEGKLVATGVVFGKSREDEGDELWLGDPWLILGWRIGFLPETLTDENGKEHEIGGLTELGLQQGTKIRLVIPSPYAYQDRPQQLIPANSPLDFTIEVLKVEAPTSTQ